MHIVLGTGKDGVWIAIDNQVFNTSWVGLASLLNLQNTHYIHKQSKIQSAIKVDNSSICLHVYRHKMHKYILYITIEC